MTPEAMRVAVAEARGWIWYRIPKMPGNTREHRALFHPDILEYLDQAECWKVRADGTERDCNMEYMEREGYLPKLNLDEMHEAEETLNLNQRDIYYDHLSDISARDNDSVTVDDAWGTYHATASQRAEAFLRTIGRWVESEVKP